MVKDKILKVAGKKGKTKDEIAVKLNISYSACSVAVNELLDEGKLTVTGKVSSGSGLGRPALKFGVAA